MSDKLALGTYPTPVQHLAALSNDDCQLWVKRDDLTSVTYGGNKVRKLEWLLGEALARGHRRIVTVGAAGSHHVLATAHFGRRAGIAVEGVLVPQPSSEHVAEVLRASLAQGLLAFPVRSWVGSIGVLIWRIASGAHLVTVGGSSVSGAMGYVEAARELARQVRAGELPEPDVCVVALGSGGTAAGLAAGFESEGLRARVVGVCVSQPPWLLRLATLHLARRCARRTGVDHAGSRLRARLVVDRRFLGRGYGYETEDGRAATQEAREVGLTLDPTYTAKTFACARWYVRARAARVVLYWHTLSSAPMQPLLAAAEAPEASEGARQTAPAVAGDDADDAGEMSARVGRLLLR
jgi:1-aminocyclopropane-1-carboxylate deaminase/D-cysteine desulfhydrase-like pyridoxal-dependent ACC family enzyme